MIASELVSFLTDPTYDSLRKAIIEAEAVDRLAVLEWAEDWDPLGLSNVGDLVEMVAELRDIANPKVLL